MTTMPKNTLGMLKKETKRFSFLFFSTRDARCNGKDKMASRGMIKDVEKHG
jgi:hypothetical protein